MAESLQTIQISGEYMFLSTSSRQSPRLSDHTEDNSLANALHGYS